MRLWHKDLIRGLPRQQLLSQWRECCLIAKNIKEKGTPNHILVNKIMDYSISHFRTYSYLVADEMYQRGYRVDRHKFEKYFNLSFVIDTFYLFEDWHNNRYMEQCYYNLQEKWDCGGIPEEEWLKFERVYMYERYDYSDEVWREVQRKVGTVI